MSSAHELLRMAMRQSDEPGPGVHWDRIRAALNEVSRPIGAADGTEALDADSQNVFLELLEFDGEVALSKDSTLPHAAPPAELMRGHAIQMLARADLDKHRAAIQRLADRPGTSPRLAAIARMVLGPE